MAFHVCCPSFCSGWANHVSSFLLFFVLFPGLGVEPDWGRFEGVFRYPQRPWAVGVLFDGSWWPFAGETSKNLDLGFLNNFSACFTTGSQLTLTNLRII